MNLFGAPWAPRGTAVVVWCWEDEAHRTWVTDLGIRLRAEGWDPIVDRWDAGPGAAMSKAVTTVLSGALSASPPLGASLPIVAVIGTPGLRQRHRWPTEAGGYPLDHTLEDLRRRGVRVVVLVRRGDPRSAVPPALQDLPWTDARKDGPGLWAHLLGAIAGADPGPPVAPTADPHCVPAPAGALIGRDALVDALDLRLGSGTSVVLVGVPDRLALGIGRSWLAQHYAWRRRSDWDRVVWLPADAADPDVVLASLSPALGVSPEISVARQARSVLEVLGSGERVLLILDGVQSRSAFERLQPLGGAVSLIVTQEGGPPLLPHQLEVPPLSTDAARALLAVQSLPGWWARRSAGQLAEALDGHPLSLAAARWVIASGVPPQDLLYRVRGGLWQRLRRWFQHTRAPQLPGPALPALHRMLAPGPATLAASETPTWARRPGPFVQLHRALTALPTPLPTMGDDVSAAARIGESDQAHNTFAPLLQRSIRIMELVERWEHRRDPPLLAELIATLREARQLGHPGAASLVWDRLARTSGVPEAIALELAVGLLEDNAPERALDALNLIMTPGLQTDLLRARCALALRRLEAARTIVATLPDLPLVRLLHAQLFSLSGDLDAAEASFRAVLADTNLEQQAARHEASMGLLDILEKRADNTGVCTLAAKLLESPSVSPAHRSVAGLQLACALWAMGDQESARARFLGALDTAVRHEGLDHQMTLEIRLRYAQFRASLGEPEAEVEVTLTQAALQARRAHPRVSTITR